VTPILRKIFTGINISKLELKNRIVMSPLGMNIRPVFIQGEINPRLFDFYIARARGGAGLIILSAAYTESKAQAYKDSSLGIWEDSFIYPLRRLTRAIQQYGTRVGLHLVHGGSYVPSSISGRNPISASSSFVNWLTGERPREATKEEIGEIVINFGKAVKRAMEAGFDLVEYNAYSGYLLREFLSPLTNQRLDEYGGGLENRFRLLREIIEASRKEVGNQYPLIVKISGDEYFPGGNRLKDAIELAIMLENSSVDGIHVSPAGHQTPLPLTPGFVPKGAFLYLAKAIKENVNIPVITAHVGDIFIAEKAVSEGIADLIAFGRSFLADPEFPIKAMEGRFEEIRPCIRCCQGCYDRIFQGEDVTCLMNPFAGREREWEITPASKKKNVMVIGGGPAGMQASIVLAHRGHNVSIYERNDRLGGQLKLSSVIPGKEEFAEAIRYFTKELSIRNVRVKLNVEVSPEIVRNINPDAVLIATGSVPSVPQIPGVDRENVHTAWEILEGKVSAGKRVVIIGGGGVGCETAIFLAKSRSISAESLIFLSQWDGIEKENLNEFGRINREIYIIEILPSVARDMGISRRGFIRRLLNMNGVKTIVEAKDVEILEEGVAYLNKEGKKALINADTVILATGNIPSNSLYDEISKFIKEVYLIGDAKSPRKALDAIHEATLISLRI
jgi:2,4-dienoyl-CoA reductase (NADPH2)